MPAVRALSAPPLQNCSSLLPQRVPIRFVHWYASLSGNPRCTLGYTYQQTYVKVINSVRSVSISRKKWLWPGICHLVLVHLLRWVLILSLED